MEQLDLLEIYSASHCTRKGDLLLRYVEDIKVEQSGYLRSGMGLRIATARRGLTPGASGTPESCRIGDPQLSEPGETR